VQLLNNLTEDIAFRSVSPRSLNRSTLVHVRCTFHESSSTLRFLAPFLVWFCCSVSTLSAQAPKLEASIDADEVFIGESISYQVDVRNVEEPPTPDLSAIADQFEIESNGSESRNQLSTFIFNGRMTQKNVYSHVYSYKLKPKVVGKLTIPPATVVIDGKTLNSASISIHVLEVEVQDVVLAQVVADQEKLFPTQVFSVTLKVLVKSIQNSSTDPLQPLRRKPPHLQVDWLKPIPGLKAEDTSEWLGTLLAKNGVGFSINEFSSRSGSLFDSPRAAVFNLKTGREERKDLKDNRTEYFVYELNRSFTAEKPGTYSFGPAIVKGTFVTGMEGSEFVGKKIFATTSAIDVVVKEVPSPRPALYTGGIGEYRVKASASPMNLRVGDPVTLMLDFERGKNSGSLELLSAPDLNSIPEIASDFDIVDTNPTGRVEGNSKKFGYAIRPKRPGVIVPSLPLSMFDPIAEKFIEVKTDPIAIAVAEASQVSTSEIVGTISKSSANEIKMSSKGIFQNITDPSLLRDESIHFGFVAKVLVGLWAATGLGIAFILVSRGRSSDTVRQRKQRASKTARIKLHEAARLSKEPKLALRTIREAIIGLVADSTNRVADGMTSADVVAAMLAADIPKVDQTEVQRLLDQIEASEYGAGMGLDTNEMLQSARMLADRIAPYLDRSFR
jgi:hypothetical protein